MVGHDLAPKKVNYNHRAQYEFKVYITFIMYEMLLFFDFGLARKSLHFKRWIKACLLVNLFI